MKKIILFILFFSFSIGAQAQILTPVKWSTTSKQVSDSEFDLIFTATIDEGWTVYSQYLESEDGPVPTSFHFEKGDHYTLVGKNKESGTIKKGYDPFFSMNVIKIYKKGIFTQRVKVTDLSQPITGYLEFVTCDDERCLPPAEEEFSFQLVAAPKKVIPVEPTKPIAPPSNKTIQTPTLQHSKTSNALAPKGIKDPVKWQGELRKISDTEFELIYHATMDKGWCIYSQFLQEGGPIPTEFIFLDKNRVKIIGKNQETGAERIEGFDDIFKMPVVKFKKNATFTQRVQVSDANQPASGLITYMSCNDGSCIPLEITFKADFTNLNLSIGEEAPTIDINTDFDTKSAASAIFGNFPKPDLASPQADCGTATLQAGGKSYWSIFLLGFLGGLLALLTPCVFPMIPLTVSFFTKSSKDRRRGVLNATWYGFFILAAYTLLSIPFHLMDNLNPDILNDLSTNVWLNLAFFAIFVFFAFSFFGFYELTLPSSWVNRTSSAEGAGGILGIFFMALTLALVSFSCTGPILGSLLAGALSSDGGAWQLTAGMGGFGLALALPFALFALFPSWMTSLPKSGGWLNTVKVVLGFVELALALKFLSNADLVKHWGILKIEPFLASWILIAIGLALYLFRIIKFPHDSLIKKLSVTRIGLGLASVAFAIYLATGFLYDEKAGSYRPLKLLSGLAPPACYSWFYECDCPQNLNCFKDLNQGLAYAREVGKPVMIDFTGYACVNCRKMEEHVWPESEVYKYLKNDYVLISLYVDEKVELPENEQIEVQKATGGTRKLRNMGHKWSHFQTEYFNTNTQPYYVLLSPDGKLLNNPVGYTPEEEKYAGFLQCGLEAYQRLSAGKQLDKTFLGVK